MSTSPKKDAVTLSQQFMLERTVPLKQDLTDEEMHAIIAHLKHNLVAAYLIGFQRGTTAALEKVIGEELKARAELEEGPQAADRPAGWC